MLQNPLLPVDVSDGAPATRRVGVTRVVGHEAEVVFVDLDLPEVHSPDGAVSYLDVIALARTIVRDRKTLGPRGSRTPPITRALRLFGQPAPLSLARTLIIYARVTYVSAPKCFVRCGYYRAPGEKRKGRRIRRTRARKLWPGRATGQVLGLGGIFQLEGYFHVDLIALDVPVLDHDVHVLDPRAFHTAE